MIDTVIEYKIDNFSSIKKINDWKYVYFYNKELDWRSKDRKPLFINKNLCGVYILYNEFKEIIYIGKSKEIRNRLACHLFQKGALKYMSFYEENHFLCKRNEAVYFSYIKVDNQFIDLVEIGLINKHQPKYNLEYNSNGYAHNGKM
tara:strand:+ start:67 stop:504 length:438 start_codon:yes stop_codon:yes gene_type:complete